MDKRGILFLTLRVFSATGGIEKVCRIAGKALNELLGTSPEGGIKLVSLYDNGEEINNKYFPATIFKGCGNKKTTFCYAAIKEGTQSKVVILSHVNLLVIGFLIKLISPKTKLMLFAHGIEVWKTFPAWKIKMLSKLDLILPVSEFTKNKMMQLYQLPAEKFKTLNNCLDPFLPEPPKAKDCALMQRYGFKTDDKILLSLTRMADSERYKGYDQVMHAVKELKEQYPSIKYLIVGKYDLLEKIRIDTLIAKLGLQQQVVLTGFIPDEDLATHYNLADLYIMPSQKEGFGIVFIEAMFYGKPVIAGNADGSVDALCNGLFGLLVNPTSQQEITDGIVTVLKDTEKYTPQHTEVLKYFSYEVYKEKLSRIIS